MANRQVVLDTETTGISTKDGHRIIEIGAVEMIERRLTGRTYHQYINPEREVEEEAFNVHGISDEFLSNQPVFSHIVDEFISFIKGSELIIHNAPFDIGFIDFELSLLKSFKQKSNDFCTVLDTLVLAKELHPGQRNNLDALCRRYYIDNTNRELHGALLDSELLADVYLAMTGGQVNLSFSGESDESTIGDTIIRLDTSRRLTRVLHAKDADLANHEQMMKMIEKNSGKELKF